LCAAATHFVSLSSQARLSGVNADTINTENNMAEPCAEKYAYDSVWRSAVDTYSEEFRHYCEGLHWAKAWIRVFGKTENPIAADQEVFEFLRLVKGMASDRLLRVTEIIDCVLQYEYATLGATQSVVIPSHIMPRRFGQSFPLWDEATPDFESHSAARKRNKRPGQSR
jgi:hypothetical protein